MPRVCVIIPTYNWSSVLPFSIRSVLRQTMGVEKLEAIGGSSAIVPSEGLVFKYKGNIYKFTGAFAPINQILGSLKF